MLMTPAPRLSISRKFAAVNRREACRQRALETNWTVLAV